MLDNPPPAQSTTQRLDWYGLPDHQLVELSGTDALRFAQSQFMNDVLALNTGYWQWNGWLNPKGRVIALFPLLVIDPETLWLILADMPAQDFVARLERFRFRSKLAISVREDAHVTGRFSPSLRASGNHWSADRADEIELDLSGDSLSDKGRCLRLSHRHPSMISSEAAVRWASLDLEHGWPRLDPAQREQWTPQQLSLDRVGAYSVKKGCYPGQEIVARTHFLGQAKRGIALLESSVPMSAGDELQIDGRSVGAVVGVAGTTALAVLPIDVSANDQILCRGIRCTIKPLAGGFER